jgi:hypothetical protein
MSTASGEKTAFTSTVLSKDTSTNIYPKPMRPIKSLTALILIFTTFASSGQIQLFFNGSSEYRIVIPADANPLEDRASIILQDYLGRISGFKMDIVTDLDEPIAREILVGRTNRLDESGIRVKTEKLDRDGFAILTVKERLFIIGGSPQGTLNGVYTFLEEHLGCRMYTTEAVVVPRSRELVLPRIKDIQNPVFTYRETYFPGRFDPLFREWHKLHSHHSNEWGLWVHTFDDFVPPKTYFREHPEYFSEINGKRVPDGQLCLSNPEVFAVLTENLKQRISEEPDALYWSVSQNDNYLACQCSGCRAEAEHYGGESGLMIRFVNDVARMFPEKVISTLAYQYTRSAPEGIIPLPNVNIMLCSIECNRSLPLLNDPSSASFVKDVKDWSKLTSNILIWDYVVQFRNYISPFPNLRVLQPNLEFFADEGCRMMFQQGSGGAKSEFYELRTYLIAKLLWNPYQDPEAIIDEFLAGYYGAAAPYIGAYIDMIHNELESAEVPLWIYGFPFDGAGSYLRSSLIPEYERLFDEAEAAVAGEPEYLARVRAARLPLDFAIMDISLHAVDETLSWVNFSGGRYENNPGMLKRLDRFVQGCGAAGVEMLNEQGYKPEEYRETVLHYLVRSEERSLAMHKPVNLLTEFSPKYPAGGAAALTDRLRGINDYHFNWLGFEGNDLEAIIDLGEEMTVSKVSASFLQDVRSWIFLPKSLEAEYSLLGFTYNPAGKDLNVTPDNTPGSFFDDFTIEFQPVRARYIKVKAESLKTCPDWHLGKGKKSWIFVDEIIIQ